MHSIVFLLKRLVVYLRRMLRIQENVPLGTYKFYETVKKEPMKLELDTVLNANSLATINANFQKIEQELQEKVLYRDNPTGEPNTMEQALDMNGKDILNIGDLFLGDEALAPVSVVEGFKNDAEAAAAVAEAAELKVDEFNEKYIGALASDPLVHPNGSELTAGALYYNTGLNRFKVYNGLVWNLALADLETFGSPTGSNLVGYDSSALYNAFTVGAALKALNYRSAAFTPELYFGNSTTGITYQYREGTYTRIGNMCFIRIRMKLTNVGTAVGSANIRGIPFTYLGSTYPPGWIPGEFSSMSALGANTQYGASAIGIGAGRVDIVSQNMTGSSSNPLSVTNSAFTNFSVIDISFMFWAQD